MNNHKLRKAPWLDFFQLGSLAGYTGCRMGEGSLAMLDAKLIFTPWSVLPMAIPVYLGCA